MTEEKQTAVPRGIWTRRVQEHTEGWYGFLNIFRRLLGMSLYGRIVYECVMDSPVSLKPGESATFEFHIPDAILEEMGIVGGMKVARETEQNDDAAE